MPHDIESAFGGNFTAILRNKAHIVRLHAQRDFENLLRISHLKIQLRGDALTQAEDICILNVPTIRAQMHGDAASPRSLANLGCCEHVRFGIMRINFTNIAGLPQCRDVVNIDS